MPHKDKFLDSKAIPISTLRRSICYLRTLGAMSKRDDDVVSSEELANFLCLSDATVRRDLSAFGKLGTRGLGYRVGEMRSKLQEAARPNQIVFGAMVGVGRLGEALLGHGGLLNAPGLLIRSAFDVDVQKIGTVISNIRILDASHMGDTVRKESITVGIITVPNNAAQRSVDQLVEGGVSAILNFANIHVVAPPDVLISHIDIALELESLLMSLTLKARSKPAP